MLAVSFLALAGCGTNVVDRTISGGLIGAGGGAAGVEHQGFLRSKLLDRRLVLETSRVADGRGVGGAKRSPCAARASARR